MKNSYLTGCSLLLLSLVLTACSSDYMTKSRFRELDVDDRLAYCLEGEAVSLELGPCMAMSVGPFDDYPPTVAEEDLKQAFAACQAADPEEDKRKNHSECVARWLNEAGKKPGDGYTEKHLKKSIKMCDDHQEQVDGDTCVSRVLPFVYIEETE